MFIPVTICTYKQHVTRPNHCSLHVLLCISVSLSDTHTDPSVQVCRLAQSRSLTTPLASRSRDDHKLEWLLLSSAHLLWLLSCLILSMWIFPSMSTSVPTPMALSLLPGQPLQVLFTFVSLVICVFASAPCDLALSQGKEGPCHVPDAPSTVLLTRLQTCLLQMSEWLGL